MRQQTESGKLIVVVQPRFAGLRNNPLIQKGLVAAKLRQRPNVILSWHNSDLYQTNVTFQDTQNTMRAVFTEAIAKLLRTNRKISASMTRDLSFSCRGEYSQYKHLTI